MRISLLFIWLCSMPIAADTYAEAARISITANNEPLEKVLRQIESQSEFLFFYNSNNIDKQMKVSVKIANKGINEAMGIITGATNLSYVIKDRHIILSKNETPVVKDEFIKGRIVDDSGEALIGANILIKGTSTGTISDIDGNFSLRISGSINNPILRVTYIGYVSVEKPVKNQKDFLITLNEDQTTLKDVVVVGYGVQKKESITSAIAALGSEDIERSAATTTSGALVGKIPGLNTRMPDGRPGGWTHISIRNMGTPLYVIDGVQKDEGSFNNIDFNDIESVSVLKDASAAIYGVRAANGVIVVTTKSGKRNTRNEININSYYGTQSMFKYPKPADALTYVKSIIQSNTVKGDTRKYSEEDLSKWEQGTEKGYRSFDWYDYILQSAPQYYVSANSSGGSENINYYFAISHLSQDAAIRNHGGFERSNLQANIDANITKKLKVGLSINGRIDEKAHPGLPGDDDTWRALFAIYRNLPTIRPYANDNPNYPAKTSSGGDTNFAIFNEKQSGKYRDKWRVFQTNFTAEYSILPELKVKGVFGYWFANRWMDNQEYSFKLYKYDEISDAYDVVHNYQGKYRERDVRNQEEIMSQLNLSYDKKFGDHALSAVLGAETYKKSTPGFWVHYTPLSDAVTLIYGGNQLKSFNDSGDETQARLGYMGRLNYTFADKYLLEVAARYDGSWKYPKKDRWGFFPSISAGWRVSEEPFWKESAISKIVSDFKPRISYGVLGDDNVPGYAAFGYLDGYNYNRGGAVLEGEYLAGTQPRPPAVEHLSWLKAKMFDVGADFSFFNGRLQGSFDYFRRTRTGLPAGRYDVLIPSEAGFNLPVENLDSDVHTGVDGMLKWHSKVGDFQYTVGANMTFARQYSWYNYNDRFGSSWNRYRFSGIERYANINWGLVSDGQFQSWEEIANHPIDIDGKGNATMRPGDIKYKDINNDGTINSLDERPIGYLNGGLPYMNYGLNLSANYKGFDLSLDFSGSSYASYTLNYESRNPFHGDGNNPQYYLENQWRLSDIFDPNSELIPGKYPMALEGNSAHTNYQHSDFWMTDVNYIKLRNLEFGYSFPKKWLSSLKIQKLRVYTLMQNLFCIDNLGEIEIDPEITSDSGINYPTNRVINFGINLTF